MDISTLAQGVTTALIPFLPYALQKIGDGALTEIGKKTLNNALDATKALWDRIRTKVETKSAALEAAQDLAANPEDADSQAALRNQLKKLLSEDSSFAAEVEQLFNKVKEASGTSVSADHGGVAIGGNATGNTIITGGIKGDFVGGNKDKS